MRYASVRGWAWRPPLWTDALLDAALVGLVPWSTVDVNTRSWWALLTCPEAARVRLRLAGGALADSGAEGVEFCQNVGGGPDAVAFGFGKQLEHSGIGESVAGAIALLAKDVTN